ncbi:transposase [Streptomyces sp. NPDC059909]|uniref:transposase n=1 Tax=Streptomyces sp. NPDC059909 TaxID=3346998 RepID=UPI0036657565
MRGHAVRSGPALPGAQRGDRAPGTPAQRRRRARRADLLIKGETPSERDSDRAQVRGGVGRWCNAVGWRLFLPGSWDDAKNPGDALLAEAIRRRRAKAGIPDEVRHRERWRLALDMLDETREDWELPDLPVVADAGYGDATGFREGLTERGLPYAVAVKGSTTCYPGDAVPERPPYSGQGRPPNPAYPQPHTTLRALTLAAGRQAARTVTWRHGSKATRDNPHAAMRSRFLALRVRPANRTIRRGVDGSLPDCWLLAEWPPGAAEPTRLLAVHPARRHPTA